MKTRIVFAFAMACVLLMIGRSAAEAQESYATLLGKISDQTGAGVSGAKVTVTSEETGLTRVVTTTGDGNYRVALLPAGGYSFKVESSGFAAREQSDLLLRVGDERRVDVTLSPGQVNEVVT